MELVSIPVILAIVYSIIELLKLAIKSEKFKNFIPLISGVLGIILGIVAFYVSPDLMPTDNVFYAILVGLCCGLSATGSNQIIKQVKDIIIQSKNIADVANPENKITEPEIQEDESVNEEADTEISEKLDSNK